VQCINLKKGIALTWFDFVQNLPGGNFGILDS
jgi:hypothetical protein